MAWPRVRVAVAAVPLVESQAPAAHHAHQLLSAVSTHSPALLLFALLCVSVALALICFPRRSDKGNVAGSKDHAVNATEIEVETTPTTEHICSLSTAPTGKASPSIEPCEVVSPVKEAIESSFIAAFVERAMETACLEESTPLIHDATAAATRAEDGAALSAQDSSSQLDVVTPSPAVTPHQDLRLEDVASVPEYLEGTHAFDDATLGHAVSALEAHLRDANEALARKRTKPSLEPEQSALAQPAAHYPASGDGAAAAERVATETVATESTQLKEATEPSFKEAAESSFIATVVERAAEIACLEESTPLIHDATPAATHAEDGAALSAQDSSSQLDVVTPSPAVMPRQGLRLEDIASVPDHLEGTHALDDATLGHAVSALEAHLRAASEALARKTAIAAEKETAAAVPAEAAAVAVEAVAVATEAASDAVAEVSAVPSAASGATPTVHAPFGAISQHRAALVAAGVAAIVLPAMLFARGRR